MSRIHGQKAGQGRRLTQGCSSGDLPRSGGYRGAAQFLSIKKTPQNRSAETRCCLSRDHCPNGMGRQSDRGSRKERLHGASNTESIEVLAL
jgi:hypothetical protein